MLPHLVLLPPLGHKEAIGTLGYPIASKLEDQLHLYIQVLTDTHTHTSAFIIQMNCLKIRFLSFIFQVCFEAKTNKYLLFNIYHTPTSHSVLLCTPSCYIAALHGKYDVSNLNCRQSNCSAGTTNQGREETQPEHID